MRVGKGCLLGEGVLILNFGLTGGVLSQRRHFLRRVEANSRIHGIFFSPSLLSLSCVMQKKTARKKWPCEILGARSMQKVGLPAKPKTELCINGQAMIFNGPMICWSKVFHSQTFY